jgi:predicted nucleotidyltransferase
MLADYLHAQEDSFLKLCKMHDVKKIYVFGSAVTSEFDPVTSDIDMVVEIGEKDPLQKGEMLMRLWDMLEDFFKRKVDLLTDQPIKNPYLKSSIERTKVLIYDGEGQKILV